MFVLKFGEKYKKKIQCLGLHCLGPSYTSKILSIFQLFVKFIFSSYFGGK